MKLRTDEAARQLGMHPANLLLYLVELGAPLEEVWPDLEGDWLQAIRSKHWERFGQTADLQASGEGTGVETPHRTLGVSEDASLVIEKLWRKQKWGAVSVSVDSLKRLTHLSPERLGDAIKELCAKGLLTGDPGLGPWSLNPGQKREVDAIAQLVVRLGHD